MPRRMLTPEEYEFLKSADLGNRLRLFRREVGKLHTNKTFTTLAMSERMEIKQQTIISIERGDSKKPAYQLMYKITQDLGLPFDALTDDFYEGFFRPIPIGEPSGNPESFIDEGEQNIRTSIIGAVLYECQNDNTVRLIHDLRSCKSLEKAEFISVLARLIGELQSTEKVERLFTERHPVVQASELYNALDTSPEAFPPIKEEVWTEALNALITSHQPKGDNENE